MTQNKNRRIATAAGFLSGVLACLDALRNARVAWPPDAAWALLSHPQRLEFGGGAALIAVTIVVSLMRGNQGR